MHEHLGRVVYYEITDKTKRDKWNRVDLLKMIQTQYVHISVLSLLREFISILDVANEQTADYILHNLTYSQIQNTHTHVTASMLNLPPLSPCYSRRTRSSLVTYAREIM